MTRSLGREGVRTNSVESELARDGVSASPPAVPVRGPDGRTPASPPVNSPDVHGETIQSSRPSSAFDLGESGASSPPRLEPVEGLRAYLALWVVVCHVMWASGYQSGELFGLAKVLREGGYAVKVFIIISAFVIFLLLDTKRMTFGQFIVRRFFRLFPLFILLFLIAIPISRLSLWNVTHAAAYLSPEQMQHEASRIQSWWQNLHWHISLHVPMLHGAVPQALLQDAPGAFLDAAWSVSLEWQFYLVAPLAFGLAVSGRPSRRFVLCLGCALLYLASTSLLPPVGYGAALPFHIDYFFLGAVSYFVYRRYSGQAGADAPFPISCCFAIYLVILGRSSLIPIALWIAFLGLILEPRSSYSWRIVSFLFTNRIAQRLGRVSYSIYLSHLLLLALLQYVLLRWMPDLGRGAHFWVLLCLTTGATIIASQFLHQQLEAPGISLGRALARRLGRSDKPATSSPKRPRISARVDEGSNRNWKAGAVGLDDVPQL